MAISDYLRTRLATALRTTEATDEMEAVLEAAQSIETAEIATGAVTTPKIADLNVTEGKLAALSVTNGKIGALAVDAAKLASDSVTTAKILNSNVTLAKLAAGISPSHVVKFAGTFTTLGGDTTESITVTGALGTDIVQVSVKTAGAAPVSIVAATAATDAITVTTSADPSTDHVFQYMVLRASS